MTNATISVGQKEAIAAYNAERDAMLMECDVDKLIAFHAKHGLFKHSSRDVAEISMHKARTAIVALPIEARQASKRWLTERGYTSLDDGELS